MNLRVFAILFVLLASGCATTPRDVDRPESYAFENTDATFLGQLTGPSERAHIGQSGFHLLPNGLRALETRFAMVDLAEISVDVQTYDWSPDLAGEMLGLRLWNAAERGVRIRVLIDDFLLDDEDFDLAAFDSHPNAEVRLYNPFGTRFAFKPIAKLRRSMEMATNLSRLNHRMHNKTFTVDNQLAIVGGRNVADHYYGLSEDFNFVDFDLLVSGPLVDDVSMSFDEFWNSEWAYPITVFKEHPPLADARARIVENAERFNDKQRELGIPVTIEPEQVALQRFIDGLSWAFAEITFDDPDKGRGANKLKGSKVHETLRELAAETDSELLILTPYLVLRSMKGSIIEELLDNDVTVKMLTNSLATTNQVAVHSGYARYRKDMLRAGIELYELQPDIADHVQEARAPWSTGNGSLHTKVVVFDREIVFVGTYNMDPRSAQLNTELGFVIRSPAIAQRIGAFADALLEPDSRWRVSLDANGDLVWSGLENGVSVTHTSEPRASVWRKTKVFLFSLLPIEDHL